MVQQVWLEEEKPVSPPEGLAPLLTDLATAAIKEQVGLGRNEAALPVPRLVPPRLPTATKPLPQVFNPAPFSPETCWSLGLHSSYA